MVRSEGVVRWKGACGNGLVFGTYPGLSGSGNAAN